MSTDKANIDFKFAKSNPELPCPFHSDEAITSFPVFSHYMHSGSSAHASDQGYQMS